MTQIDYALLMQVLGLFALYSSLFVLTTIKYEQNIFVQIVRSFVSCCLFVLAWALRNQFA